MICDGRGNVERAPAKIAGDFLCDPPIKATTIKNLLIKEGSEEKQASLEAVCGDLK